ncbi:MAG: metallophosphoesterase, partial [Pirellulaceae bacterium]|nr:metallophosphoesterase [Pirellulaceae bacterium]
MDRRSFLIQSGAILGTLGLGQNAVATEPRKSDKASKPIAKGETPPLPFVPGSWSIVILPDIQNYSTSYPGLTRLQTQWIVDHKKSNNIAYVLQNGDVTNRNRVWEWERASQGLGILDGVVPYAIVPGNHDLAAGNAADRTTRMNDYFPPSRFKNWATFGGTMEKGHIENNYHLFEAGGKQWLVIGLEWGPRDQALEWADGLLRKHADRRAIVFTHAYLYDDSTRYDWAAKGKAQKWNPHAYPTPGSVNDGEEMWNKLLKKHANVFMAMNGHVCGDGLGFQ